MSILPTRSVMSSKGPTRYVSKKYFDKFLKDQKKQMAHLARLKKAYYKLVKSYGELSKSYKNINKRDIKYINASPKCQRV